MVHPYPPLRPYGIGEVWAQTAAEASDFDADAIERVGVPQPVLMENAGRSAALVLQRLFPEGRVVGVVGAGNNGGDALVALRSLAAWGRDVCALQVAERPQDDPLLHGWSLSLATDGGLGGEGVRDLLDSAEVVIDGVLGTGIRGEPRPRQADAIGCMNESGRPVLAIDVPSGIDATTGAVPGRAVRVDVTVAFGAPKLGALLHPARALVGRHVVVDIGFPPLVSTAARVVGPTWARARCPQRLTDTHKNQVGRVLVVAGHVGMAGAAILSARGAFRAGAGLVRVCSVPENRGAIQAGIPEAIFVDASDDDALAEALAATEGLAAGPGMGTSEAACALLRRVLAGPAVPTVLDADALNLAAGGAGPDLAKTASGRPLLITPHPGEMARLLADVPSSAQDRVEAVRHACERFGCAVLLKGAPSLVAAPGDPLAIDTQGSSDLAVAGMGDVLTGVCAGLLAQGLAPEEAGPVALYLSGRAARIAGRGAALTPSDVLRWLPDALTEPATPESDLCLPFVTFDADPAR
jgi:hydroxyethylthiazole kinase-like uncharacterized protein yjeF